MPTNPCNAVLIPEIDITILNQQEKTHLLDIVDQESWKVLDHTRKRELFIATSYGTGEYTDDYAKFEEMRDRYFRETNYSRNSSLSLQRIRSRVPDRAIEAWEKCMLGGSTDGYGITHKAEALPDHEVRLVVTARRMPEEGRDRNRPISLEQGTCSAQLISQPNVPYGKAFPKNTSLTDGVPRVFRYKCAKDDAYFTLDADSSLGPLSVRVNFIPDLVETKVPLNPRELIFGGSYSPYQPSDQGGWNINLKAHLSLEDVEGDWYEVRVHYDLAMQETNRYGLTQPNGMSNWSRNASQTVARFQAAEAHLVHTYADSFYEHVAYDGGRTNYAGGATTLVEGWTYSVRETKAGFRLKPEIVVKMRPL